MLKTLAYPLVLAAALAYGFSLLIGFTPDVLANGAVLWRFSWVPNLDLQWSFRLDGLSLIFSLLITGIGALIFVYAAAYMKLYQRTPYFFTILFLFTLSMLGLVLADHLMVLFIFWELTTITSYLLIGFNSELQIARRNAIQALLVTGGAGLVLFAGLVWIGVDSGSYYLTDLLADPEIILQHPSVNWIFICIFIGCIAKSAQVPFHFWLPNAMAAPTPVSAFLHSATMVKAGIYLLARLQPVFGELEIWMPLLGTLGGITAVWGSLMALTQSDLKQLLAYTTLMALGTITFLLAFPSEHMAAAAMVFLVVHALYKACLFMMVGIVDQYTGTRQTDQLSGLKAPLPHIWVLALLAGLSMAGIPLLFGFVAKELQYQAALGTSFAALKIAVLMLANALMIVAAYMVCVKPFIGAPSDAVTKSTAKLSPLLWIAPAVLAALGLTYGMAPDALHQPFMNLAASSVYGNTMTIAPGWWHGVNTPFLLSVITFCLGGIGICMSRGIITRMRHVTDQLPTVEGLYYRKMHLLKRLAIWVTRHLHTGSLEFYIRITITYVFGLILIVILQNYSLISLIPTLPDLPDWIGIALSFLAIAGAYYAIVATTKIMALAALGASGFAMAGIFLLYGALDVAMTQLLVETLFVILAAALLWRIPEMSLMSKCTKDSRHINLFLAVMAGITSTLVMWVVLRQPLDLSLTYFFEHASYTMAHGRNIVNVILVDFRAFDTMGEATVIAAAALGLWSLTRKIKPKEGSV